MKVDAVPRPNRIKATAAATLDHLAGIILTPFIVGYVMLKCRKPRGEKLPG